MGKLKQGEEDEQEEDAEEEGHQEGGAHAGLSLQFFAVAGAEEHQATGSPRTRALLAGPDPGKEVRLHDRASFT